MFSLSYLLFVILHFFFLSTRCCITTQTFLKIFQLFSDEKTIVICLLLKLFGHLLNCGWFWLACPQQRPETKRKQAYKGRYKKKKRNVRVLKSWGEEGRKCWVEVV